MSFSVIYPHTAFTSIGANKVKPKALQVSILATPAIVTAFERIRVENPGTGNVPEVDDPTGRTWAFVFAGAGPLSGPETTALNAIVAAHTGVDAADPVPAVSGTVGYVWTSTAGAPEWAPAPGGGGGEANTTSNAGATGTGIALAKVGVDLPIAKIDGVNGISESLISNVLTIDGVALLPRDGSRAMTGNLALGSNAITGVTTIAASGAISASNLSGTNTGDQTITLTGDVTGTGTGSFATAIASNAVTTAKINDAAVTLAKIIDASAASVLLGRGSAAGGGDFQEITLGAGLSMSNQVLSASGGGSGDVTAASAFGFDNRLTRSDGTAKGIQGSGITVDDSNNISGVADLACATQSVTTGANVNSSAITITTTSGDTHIHVGSVGSPPLVPAAGGSVILGASQTSLGGGSSPVIWVRWDGSSADGPWAPALAGRPVLSNAIDGMTLSWVSSTSVAVVLGGSCVVKNTSTAEARVITSSNTLAINTGTSGLLGLDTGTITTNRWYYVWMIAKNSNGSSGQDISAIMSLSATTPTLPSGYTMQRRIGTVRTSSASTSLLEFYQHGTSNVRTYYYDSLTEFIPLSGGSATAATTLGHSAGAGALPSTADFLQAEITTNATAACRIRPNSGISVNLIDVAISQTKKVYCFPCTNGTFQYINSVAGGSSTIAVHWFSETL
jgi:hypothetical protein